MNFLHLLQIEFRPDLPLMLCAIHDFAFPPTLLRSEYRKMTYQYLLDINAKNGLITRPYRVDERPNKALVSPSMTASFVGGVVCRLLTSSEIGHRKRIHIADYLAMRKMKACLPFTNERRICNHREGGGRARRELDIDHLLT